MENYIERKYVIELFHNHSSKVKFGLCIKLVIELKGNKIDFP